MRLIQFIASDGTRQGGAILEEKTEPLVVRNATTVRDLALDAFRRETSLQDAVESYGFGEAVDYDAIVGERRLLVPLDHPEPSRTVIAPNGPTPPGSAQSREPMPANHALHHLRDSMK